MLASIPGSGAILTNAKSVVSDIEMRVVVPTGIDGTRSRGSVCSGALASVKRREVQRE